MGRQPVTSDVTLFTKDDLYLFNEGTHFHLYEKLGAHRMTVDGEEGMYFAVWAPDARHVFVVGNFNGWDKGSHPLRPRGRSGIWEGFVPGVRRGALYKYHIVSRYKGYRVDKTDPFAFYDEVSPKTASVVWDLDYSWGDQDWMARRGGHNALSAPIAVYEVHLGSWMRVAD
ncbi:MAG: 1,4-alpha-glucan branching enzyme, partial [Dehalococcoidia bacterium]|nr:1,4-alpha-glucan branching enzyme [Dehalococcoidia bacterium]